MTSYRVTHVDQHRRRRQLLLECAGRAAAEELAQAQFGPPVYMAAVRLKPSPARTGARP